MQPDNQYIVCSGTNPLQNIKNVFIIKVGLGLRWGRSFRGAALFLPPSPLKGEFLKRINKKGHLIIEGLFCAPPLGGWGLNPAY